MTELEFLKSKGLIKEGFTKFVISGDFGKIELTELLKEYKTKQLRTGGVVGSMPTRAEKNQLPENVRYAFCEAIEMYHNIQHYEFGFIDRTDFINHTIAIKDKYK